MKKTSVPPPPVPQPAGVWRQPDFLALWAGQTVSIFGSLITSLALPLVAVLTLAAGPWEVALLGAAGVAPGLALGLLAGAWADRLPRRPLLIAADLGRALLLASVPAAALLGALRIEHLYLVAAGTSALSILFEVAQRAYLPTLLRPEHLVAGNAGLAASGSVAEVAGFGLAGGLVQWLTAPVALAVDAATFLLSAGSLLLVRAREAAPRRAARAVAPHASRPAAPAANDPGDLARPVTPPAAPDEDAAPSTPAGLWREVGEGLAWVWRRPALRALAAAEATGTASAHIFVAVMLLFFVRDLGLEPALIGLLYAVGGLSALPGALLADRAVRRWGTGRTLVGGFFLNAAPNLAMALAAGPPALVVALVALPQLTDGAGTAYRIVATSLVQTATPARLLGRVTASMRVLEEAGRLLGLLLGGMLGELIGLRPTFIIGALGTVLAGLWLLRAPLSPLPAPDDAL